MNSESHIDIQVITDIILVFLVGSKPKKNLPDLIRSIDSEPWCTWTEVQELRSPILTNLSGNDMTKSLSEEMRKVFEYCNSL